MSLRKAAHVRFHACYVTTWAIDALRSSVKSHLHAESLATRLIERRQVFNE